MIPIILTGGTSADRAAEVDALFPLAGLLRTHVSAEKSSILIAQIHELTKSTGLTSSRSRLIWVEEADQLTLPAQNAFLKLLEEPPDNIQLVLSLNNAQTLLATIRSRCVIHNLTLKTDSPNLDNLAVVKSALPLKPGDRILTADSLGRKREVVLEWTGQCLTVLADKLKNVSEPKSLAILASIADLVHTAEVDLRANVSVALVMQNLFLSLPRTRLKP